MQVMLQSMLLEGEIKVKKTANNENVCQLFTGTSKGEGDYSKVLKIYCTKASFFSSQAE